MRKHLVNKKGLTPRRLLLIMGVELIALAVVLSFVIGTYTAADFYEISVGGKTVASVKTEGKVSKTRKLVEKAFQEENAKNVKVSVDPAIQSKKVYYGKLDKKPAVSSAKEAAETILGKDGEESLVKVTTNQTVKRKKAVKYKKVVKKSKEAALNTVGVAQKGEKGTEQLTVEATSVNGEIVESEVVDRQVVEKPVDEVTVQGTKVEDGAKGDTNTHLGATYSKEAGQQVADYALKWVGNPYKWGGVSLTNGADCSGFVLAVYDHFGIGLPHDAGADRAYGVDVSLDEAQPGDLICYYGHIGICIGDNKLVHAMDESHGITVSTIGYNGKRIMTVRRILG